MKKKNLQIELAGDLIDQFPIFFRQNGGKFYVDIDFYGRWYIWSRCQRELSRFPKAVLAKKFRRFVIVKVPSHVKYVRGKTTTKIPLHSNKVKNANQISLN